MITSSSTSSLGILYSTSPGDMSLLPLTPSSAIHQPLMMVLPWPNSLLAETPWYAMPMASKVKNNSSIPYMTISDSGELMVVGKKYPRKLLISSEISSSSNMSQNHTTNIKTRLNNDMVL